MKDRQKLIQNGGKILGFILFIALAFGAFRGITYLFRNADSERTRITAFENEGPLDMVYVGSSSVQLFWHPLIAWNDCGFTSYDLSSNGLLAEAVQPYMEKAAAHNPRLIVVDVRPFQFYSDLDREGYLRHSSDSMRLTDPARYRLISQFITHRKPGAETEPLSLYFDIAKYHTETERLGNPQNWELAWGEAASPTRGAEWHAEGIYAYQETPQDFMTADAEGLEPEAGALLEELLDWCRGKDFKVLFVVCPYSIQPDQMTVYNQIRNMVEKAGFDYLNANEHYGDIGIDFQTDFYDTRHVNILGARKYTAWLEKILQERYGLPDHRGEAGYDAWDRDYQKFLPLEAAAKAQVEEQISAALKGQFILQEMKQTSSFDEWSQLARDDRFILLISGKGGSPRPTGVLARNQLHEWGIGGQEEYFLRVTQNGEILYYNEALQDREKKGFLSWLDYQFGFDENGQGYTELNGERFSLPGEGISVTVLDTIFRTAVAQFLIENDEEGHLSVSDRTAETGCIQAEYGFRGTEIDIENADALEINQAEIVEDGWLDKKGVLCTGRLPLEPGMPREELQGYLLDNEFIGFGFAIEDPTPYRFLTFFGRRIQEQGEPTVYAYTDAGKVVAEAVESHQALDGDWHPYIMDLSQAREWIYIIFNGGAVDLEGSEESQFLFSDIQLY